MNFFLYDFFFFTDSHLLKIDERGLLPITAIPGFASCSVFRDLLGEKTTSCRTNGGCSLVGDVRGDENIALHSMHTLWVREHNRIARELKILNPHMDGELIYQLSRKVVGAQWARIVYEEYLPALVRLPKYKGYNKNINPSISNAFAAAAFRYGHSLVPNFFQQNNKNFDQRFPPISLQNAFFNREFINFRGIEPTMFGLAGNQSNEVDNSFSQGIARKLFVRPAEGFHSDLLAMNIQRGRDHGIPTYGEYRRLCKLSTIKSWSQLNRIMLPGAAKAFQKLYNNPNDIDLFAAGISEKHVTGSELGPTFNCLIADQFVRVREGDRFFYQNRGVFDRDQLQAIEKVTLASVLCANLKGIVSIQPRALRVPNRRSNQRVNCNRIPKLDLSPWNFKNKKVVL